MSNKILTEEEVIAKGLEKFLSGSNFLGIGEVKARKLINEFGSNFLNIVKHNSEKLLTVDGISSNNIDVIKSGVNSFLSNNSLVETRIFCKGLGLSDGIANQLILLYQDDVSIMVRNNPYLLTQFKGIGFLRANEIASSLGVKKNSPYRYNAAAEYVLDEAANAGHSYLLEEYFINDISQALKIDKKDLDLNIIKSKELFKNEIGWWLSKHWKHERAIEEKLANIKRYGDNNRFDNLEFDFGDLRLDDDQKAVISKIFDEPINIITGGAGVGKTTIIKGIISVLKNNFGDRISIGLVAPTGRAAYRMFETTGVNGFTIHRFLEARQENGKWFFNYNSSNLRGVDFLVVDETSMVNSSLLASLLSALPAKVKIIFVGDVNQLPPIGAGNPFKDIINSNLFPVFRLNKVYRSSFYSIPLACQSILAGKSPEGLENGDYDSEERCVEYIYTANDKETTEIILNYFNDDPSSIDQKQILCPMKKRTVGIIGLN